MHAAGMRPSFLDRASVPEAALQRERLLLSEQAAGSGKAEAVVAKVRRRGGRRGGTGRGEGGADGNCRAVGTGKAEAMLAKGGGREDGRRRISRTEA